jgi:transcriptional regulator with XRE-family HTH domain
MEYLNQNAISVDIGERLRQLRTERKLSQRALARLSDLSANAINIIEQGKTSPTVSTLYKLADGLEVPVTTFFKVGNQEQGVVLVRGGERVRVPFARGMWEGLGGETFSGQFEPFMLTLEVGSSSGPFQMSHSGHEFVICLRGELEYEVEGATHHLKAGDSLLFSAHKEHRWRNPGKVVTNALFVLAGCASGENTPQLHAPLHDPDGESHTPQS